MNIAWYQRPEAWFEELTKRLTGTTTPGVRGDGFPPAAGRSGEVSTADGPNDKIPPTEASGQETEDLP